MSVSYTHLDVYKRQVQAKAQLLASQGKTPLFYAYNGQMIGLIAVSYTHLDVYKRQSCNIDGTYVISEYNHVTKFTGNG